MDLTLNRATLLEELQLIQGVVERRTTIPILSNILLTAEGDRLHIAATDLDVTVFARCSAVGAPGGASDDPGQGVLRPRALACLRTPLDLSCRERRGRRAVGQLQLAAREPRSRGLSDPARGARRAGVCGCARGLAAADRPHGRSRSRPRRVTSSTTPPCCCSSAQEPRDGGDGRPPPGVRQGAVTVRERRRSSSNCCPARFSTNCAISAPRRDTPLYLARGENHLAFRLGDRMLLSRVLEARFPQYPKLPPPAPRSATE